MAGIKTTTAFAGGGVRLLVEKLKSLVQPSHVILRVKPEESQEILRFAQDDGIVNMPQALTNLFTYSL